MRSRPFSSWGTSHVFLPGSATNSRGFHRDGVCAGAADVVGAALLDLLAGRAVFPAEILYISAMPNGDFRSTRLKWEQQNGGSLVVVVVVVRDSISRRKPTRERVWVGKFLFGRFLCSTA